MTMFIECIYEFFNNPSNLAEFEEWKKSKTSSGKSEIDFDISTIRSDSND